VGSGLRIDVKGKTDRTSVANIYQGGDIFDGKKGAAGKIFHGTRKVCCGVGAKEWRKAKKNTGEQAHS